jgi:hypothetical protein
VPSGLCGLLTALQQLWVSGKSLTMYRKSFFVCIMENLSKRMWFYICPAQVMDRQSSNWEIPHCWITTN